jgi:hypothetical protein
LANTFTLCPKYQRSYFQAWWWLHQVTDMLVTGKDKGFSNRIELSTGQIPEENLVRSAGNNLSAGQ